MNGSVQQTASPASSSDQVGAFEFDAGLRAVQATCQITNQVRQRVACGSVCCNTRVPSPPAASSVVFGRKTGSTKQFRRLFPFALLYYIITLHFQLRTCSNWIAPFHHGAPITGSRCAWHRSHLKSGGGRENVPSGVGPSRRPSFFLHQFNLVYFLLGHGGTAGMLFACAPGHPTLSTQKKSTAGSKLTYHHRSQNISDFFPRKKQPLRNCGCQGMVWPHTAHQGRPCPCRASGGSLDLMASL